ncbi:MAG: hypothetical protein AAB336_09420 [Acidobacteriota bacterium]
MKIINTIFILATVALLSIACQNNSATTNNTTNQVANKMAANANQNTNQANKPETNTAANDVKSEMNTSASVSAATPTEAYKSAYAARKNKDINALKKLMAKDMFEFFEILGEGKPNPVDEGLKQVMETPQGPSDETRNEKITGDKATLQYLDKDSKWATLDLVKEDGIWKLTVAKMDDEKKSK